MESPIGIAALVLKLACAFYAGQPKCLEAEDGWRYCFTERDYDLAVRTAWCESGMESPGPGTQAVLWTLAQRFYQVREHYSTFRGFLNAYSQCAGWNWSSHGTKRTPRDIVAYVDGIRAMPLEKIPDHVRWIVRAWMAGEVQNRWPGWVHWVSGGWERHACDLCIGPFYVSDRRHRNAFYAMPETKNWTTGKLRFVDGGSPWGF